MATAVDTSVLLDVVLEDTSFDALARAALKKYSFDGLIICETALAELVTALAGRSAEEFLKQWDIQFVPSSISSAILAGRMHAQFLERGGKRGRVVPDFLIGAHAQLHAGSLLARDRGYFRDYFQNLNVIDPSTD